jgi:hypothetical protein
LVFLFVQEPYKELRLHGQNRDLNNFKATREAAGQATRGMLQGG